MTTKAEIWHKNSTDRSQPVSMMLEAPEKVLRDLATGRDNRAVNALCNRILKALDEKRK